MPKEDESLPNGNTDQLDQDLDFSESSIRNRLKEFQGAASASASSEADAAAKAAEEEAAKKVSTSSDGETVLKVEERTQPNGSSVKVEQGEKLGSDKLTKSERAALLEYKKQVEERDGKIKEYEQKLTQSEQWAKERDEARAKAKELETKYQEKDKELSGWMSKQDKIALYQVQQHELFQAEMSKIESERGKLDEPLIALCKGYEINPADVVNAHYMKDRAARNKKISEMKASFGEDDESRAELTNILQKLTELDAKERQIHLDIQSDPKGALAALKEAEEKKKSFLSEREGNQYKRARDLVWEYGIKDEYPIVKDKDVEKWVKEKVESIDWKNMPPDKRAYLAYSAFIAMKYKEEVEKKDREIARLTESVKKGSGAKLGLSKGNDSNRFTGGGDRRQSDEDEDNRTSDEALMEWRQKNPQKPFEE